MSSTISSTTPVGSLNSMHPTKEIYPKNLCFKIFVVASIVFAAIAVIVGILAVMASNGLLRGLDSLTKLRAIGKVNSYVMLCGGATLFVLGIVAWSCHLKKESSRP